MTVEYPKVHANDLDAVIDFSSNPPTGTLSIGPFKVVCLDSTGRLPALDGSELRNVVLNGNGGTVTAVYASGSPGLSVSGTPITSSGTLTFTLSNELQGLSGLATTGIVQRTGAGTYTATGLTSNQIITALGYTPATVSSVGLSVPSFLSVSGSPVTTSGTLAMGLASQNANLIFASPNGTTGTPTFRALVAADLPTLSYVSSVALTDSSTTPIFSVSGSPITTSGTLSFALNVQNSNTIFAGPNGSSGQPSFRQLVNADLPLSGAAAGIYGQVTVNTAGVVTSGTSVATASHGGTGVSTVPANGQLLIGNGTGYTVANLTTGTGISIINASGSVTIGNAGVTSIAANTGLSVSAATGGVTISGVTFNSTSAGIVPASGGGTSNFLRADGTWSSVPAGTGTVTSVGVSAGSGITVSGSPITSSGTITVTNTGVTSLTAGTGVSVSAATGGVTVSIGQSVSTGAQPSFTGLNLSARLQFANNVWNVSADGQNRLYFTANADSYYGAYSGYHHFRNGSGSDIVTIDMSGNLVASGDVTASSDANLKTDVAEITDALSKVCQLVGVTYTRKIDDGRGIGLIAQEVQKILPEIVHQDSMGYLSVAYGNITAVLIQAIKELNTKVDTLLKS